MGFSAAKPIGRVCLRKVLNRPVRSRTLGGVRGRESLTPSYSIFTIVVNPLGVHF